MKINYEIAKEKRKELAIAIKEITKHEMEYLGPPSFAYQIGETIVDKEGLVETSDETGEELKEKLKGYGFIAKNDEVSTIEVSIPLREFDSDEKLDKLENLIHSKQTLIKKALGISSLEIKIDGDRIAFPWFRKGADPEEINAYMKLITALCDAAKEAKRINPREKEVENEKYAFRCFLLRLGFIGDDFKKARKILLRNFEGNGAFKKPKKEENENA